MELNLRIKPKKCVAKEKHEALIVPQPISQFRSMDFVHDQSSDGRTVSLFNVIDDFNRGFLGIEVEFSLPSARVVHSLEQIMAWRG